MGALGTCLDLRQWGPKIEVNTILCAHVMYSMHVDHKKGHPIQIIQKYFHDAHIIT